MLFVDLDDFTTVNDNRGHGTGDRLLRAVATRLSAAIREGDLFARVGGDEFAVLLPGACDDFGTGYAALTALREFPVDVVTIDKSFVTGAATSVADEAVVYAIVEMAHRLGLETVAEGVETAEQERFAVTVGATSVQGFLLGRPMTAADLTAWLRTRAVAPAA